MPPFCQRFSGEVPRFLGHKHLEVKPTVITAHPDPSLHGNSHLKYSAALGITIADRLIAAATRYIGSSKVMQ